MLPDGNGGIYRLLITREDIEASSSSIGFADAEIVMGSGSEQVRMTAIAFGVSSARKEIVAEPGARFVTREAAESLKSATGMYLGDPQALERLKRRGKDHICVVPHGPLHYLPYHLLGGADRPLADDWIVSYLPNLHLLVSQRGQPTAVRPRTQALSAIGLSFRAANPFGLEPIEDSVEEASAIAKIFGVDPILEDRADEQTVVAALNGSRYVHLSTHGKHNVDAPAFQCLYLSPTEKTDGQLHAYELQSLDLRGLEMVTLSACETALGRFDAADNLRGLPAAFLLAGVESLVGTLWPVTPATSRDFFCALYEELYRSNSRVDAFATAQRSVRQKHPEYRDWGAFYLIRGGT